MSSLDLPGLEELRPAALTNHLVLSGWSPVGPPRHDVVVYEYDHARLTTRLGHPPDRPLRVQVLLDPTFADFQRRMAEVIDTLALLEQRTPAVVLADLLGPSADVLRVRTVNEDQRSGLINLDLSIHLRQALRDLLMATAHAVIQPKAVYPRLGFADALEFIKQCREGQTERGSYVANIFVPVAPELKSDAAPDAGVPPIADPFPRRVTVKLMEALAYTTTLLNESTFGGLTQSIDRGVNANFLDALARLEPPGERSFVELGVRFSMARRAPSLPPQVRLEQESFALLKEAARVLREREPDTALILDGYVVKTEREESAGTQPGTITIITQINPAEKPKKVRVELPVEQYRQAVDAHKNGVAVRLAGTLTRHSERSFWLRQATLLDAAAGPEGG